MAGQEIAVSRLADFLLKNIQFWFGEAQRYKQLWLREKQDRASFAKRNTELENRENPKGIIRRLIYIFKKK